MGADPGESLVLLDSPLFILLKKQTAHKVTIVTLCVLWIHGRGLTLFGSCFRIILALTLDEC